MEHFPDGHHEFGSIEDLKELLKLFRECSGDNEFLEANQKQLEKLLSHTLNTDATFHEAVATLFAVAPFVHKQDDQSQWQRITWDALVGALNLKDGGLQAQILTIFSRFHMLEGNHNLARQSIVNARDRALEQNNEVALLLAYIRFFELFVFQPVDISRAEVVQPVLELASRVNQPHLSTQLHYALAHFNNHWGDRERALGHGQYAYVLARYHGDHDYLARTAYLLVTICRLSYCRAAKHFLQVALDTDFSSLPAHDQMTSLMHQSALYYEMGKLAEAADGYRAALKLTERLKRPYYRASCLQGLALAQIRLKQFADARTNLRRAGKIWKKHGNIMDSVNHRFTEGFLEAWQSNAPIALELLDDALEMCDEIPPMASRDALRKQILETRQHVLDGTLKDIFRLA
jgi:tetratricopeptide (TPR) repeat protein